MKVKSEIQCISLAKRVRQNLSRTPTRVELLNAGITQTDLLRHFDGKAYVLLLRAGVNPLKRRWTNIEIESSIQKLAKKLERTPTLIDLDAGDNLPSRTTICSRYGTYNHLLKKIGLDVNNEPWTSDEVISSFRKFKGRHGRLPNTVDLNSVNGMDLPSFGAIKRIFGSMAEVRGACGAAPPFIFGKADAIAHVIKFAIANGRAPTIEEFRSFLRRLSRGRVSSIRHVTRHFGGSYRKLLKDAKLRSVAGELWDKSKIKRATRIFRKTTGAFPRSNDFMLNAELPDHSTVLKHFGSLEGLYVELGWKYTVRDFEAWRRWQRLVGEILPHVYPNATISRNKVKGIIGLVDYHVSHRGKNFVIDAMTSAYRGPSKKSEIERYTAGGALLEFWCLHPGNEFSDARLTYRYVGDIEKMLRRSPVSIKEKQALIQRMRKKAADDLGFYDKTELISLLSNFEQRTGMRASYRNVQRDDSMPSVQTYTRFFGSFIAAKRLAGMDPIRIPRGTVHFKSRQEAVRAVRAVAKSLGRTPSRSEFKRINGSGVSYKSVSTALEAKSWSEVVRAAGLEKLNVIAPDRQEAIAFLKMMAQLKGRNPEMRDFVGECRFPNFNVFHSLFGSFSEAVRAAGMIPSRCQKRIDHLRALAWACEQIGHNPSLREYLLLQRDNARHNWPTPTSIYRLTPGKSFNKHVKDALKYR